MTVQSGPASQPLGDTGIPAWPRRVLLATDGSEASRAAFDFWRCLHVPAGTVLEVVTVHEPGEWLLPQDLLRNQQAEAADIVDAATRELARPGLEVRPVILPGEPAHAVLQQAASSNTELLILGSHGRRGLRRFLIGSVAGSVARHADCPVLIARPVQHGLQRIVVALDESAQAEEVLEHARRLPLGADTELVLCHVVRPFSTYSSVAAEYSPGWEQMVVDVIDAQKEQGQALLQAAEQKLSAEGRTVSSHLALGDPASEILALAEERQADLVVAGSRGHSRIEKLLLGSVADRLLNAAQCSLLLVHPRPAG